MPLLEQLPRLRADLEAVGSTERAAEMAAYMRDRFPFHGVPTPRRRSIERPVIAASAGATSGELIGFARACWAEPEREFQYVAVDVLRKRAAALEPDALDDVRELIEDRSWWDTVDMLATHVVGTMARDHPEITASLDDWIRDENVWVARTAMLHQLLWKDDTDPARLFRYAEIQAANPDFFMRKAIGWALRQYARTDPDAVRDFVAAHVTALSALTRREALKRLG
jgi:3-methyladenine DNA glycosylase AlkD